MAIFFAPHVTVLHTSDYTSWKARFISGKNLGEQRIEDGLGLLRGGGLLGLDTNWDTPPISLPLFFGKNHRNIGRLIFSAAHVVLFRMQK